MAEETTSTDDTVTLENDNTTVDTQDTTTTTQDTNVTKDATTEAKDATTEAKAEPAVKDWATMRAEIAGNDEKILKRLSRYSTLQDAIKAGVEAQNKIGSIKTMTKPGKDASPEEIAAYREANDVPESPDKYEINLPNGIVLGDADKPYVDQFFKIAHKHNLSTEATNEIAAAQLEMRELEVAQRAQQDAETLEKARSELERPDVWGSEVKLNINLISGLLDGAPQGVKEQLNAARLADGTPLGNHVPTLQWLANLAREMNPMATVVPGSGANAKQAVEGELSKLEKMMGDHKSEYWKGPNADKNQTRYRDLMDAKLRSGA